MKPQYTISVFEHDRLSVGDGHFKKRHLDALLKLNMLHNFEYFDPIPNGLKFKQYVGIIQVDNIAIEIFPKADREGKNNGWRNVLVPMLKACNKLKVSTYGDANVNKQSLNLLEIYFNIYLIELSGLIRQGLIKQYRKECSNLNTLKGKIIFSKEIQKNLIHRERFYTEHHVYDKNHNIHQILNAALLIVEEFTRGTLLYSQCKQTQLNFPIVNETKITKKMLDSVKFTRKNNSYKKAFEIARLILLNYSPDISSGKEKMLALLFDMNRLWEEYVFIKLKNELDGSHYEIQSQEIKRFWGYNFLQPDIVIRDIKTGETQIIDTKWKRPGNLSASVEDLRQMYAYNRFWKASKAILLYPGISSDQEFQDFMDDNTPTRHKCKMAFVSVVDETGELSSRLGKDILREAGIKKVLA